MSISNPEWKVPKSENRSKRKKGRKKTNNSHSFSSMLEKIINLFPLAINNFLYYFSNADLAQLIQKLEYGNILNMNTVNNIHIGRNTKNNS